MKKEQSPLPLKTSISHGPSPPTPQGPTLLEPTPTPSLKIVTSASLSFVPARDVLKYRNTAFCTGKFARRAVSRAFTPENLLDEQLRVRLHRKICSTKNFTRVYTGKFARRTVSREFTPENLLDEQFRVRLHRKICLDEKFHESLHGKICSTNSFACVCTGKFARRRISREFTRKNLLDEQFHESLHRKICSTKNFTRVCIGKIARRTVSCAFTWKNLLDEQFHVRLHGKIHAQIRPPRPSTPRLLSPDVPPPLDQRRRRLHSPAGHGWADIPIPSCVPCTGAWRQLQRREAGYGAARVERGQKAVIPFAPSPVNGPSDVAVLGVLSATSGLEKSLGAGRDVSDEGVGDAGSAGGSLDELTDLVVLHLSQAGCERLRMWS